jgi:CubicO group peptidase (beta-lactamase class C family)
MKNYIPIFLLLLAQISFSQSKQTVTTQKLNKYLVELENIGFSGSVLVELNGDKIISKGFGYRNLEKHLKNNESTVFDIGSLTKQFTAAAILKLEMKGKLSVEDTISKYFDSIPTDKKSITIHDLLRHQSGLIDVVGGDYEKISQEEFIKRVFSTKLNFTPGTSFSYSNIGYSLLAIIIEKVSNQTYEKYLYNNLWKPSQMEMTGYSRSAFDNNEIAVGYEQDNKVWGKPVDKLWDEDAPYWHLKGNGGILSTTEDLYKWHKSLLTNKVLSKEAIKKLYAPKLRPEETNSSYYAYGWDVSKTNRNTKQVWHNGTNRIFYADFLRFIDEKTTFIMLSNKFHPNFNSLNFEMAKTIFNSDYHLEIPVADNIENRNFTNYIINIITELGLEKGKEEYAKKKTNQQLIEFLLREKGFNQLDNGKPEIALNIFEINAYAHPNSAKALQALGEGYMETGKNKLALKYLRKCISMNPDNPFVENLIRKLEADTINH